MKIYSVFCEQMKVKTVSVSSLKSLGDYCNETITLVVEVEEGEKVKDIIPRVQEAIRVLHKENRYPEHNYRQTYTKILSDPEAYLKDASDFAKAEYERALAWQKEQEERAEYLDDLPF